MNFEIFISRRIRSRDGSSFSRPIVKVSIAGIALGLSVMLVSVAILQGFQSQVRDKVSGFGGHIQITGFDSDGSFEPVPIDKREARTGEIRKLKGILNVQEFGLKAGIVKTDEQMEGIVLKGVDKTYDWQFLKTKIVHGRIPDNTDTIAGNEVMISQKLSDLLGIRAGDDLRMYFIIDNTARGRKFIVSGIYNTGLTEFDEMYIFGDIRHIRKLNGWDEELVSGIEINLKDFARLDEMADEVYGITGFKLNTQTIRELYPQIFDWIEIQDLNVLIILILMALVAGITVISTLLILILEHTRDIGLLKALGSTNASIRKIFIYASVNITLSGLFWGNSIALMLIFLQKTYGFIPLPEDSYFVASVPVFIDVPAILTINLATVLVCTLMMLIPSLVIRYITPVKAIRFE